MDESPIFVLGAIPASIAALLLVIWILFMCLKIKSTKKNPELLGTVGTVKVLDPAQHQNRPNSFSNDEDHQRLPTKHASNISADFSASSSNVLNVSDNSAGRVSNNLRTPSRILQGGVTNSIASERKLPDLPLGSQMQQNGLAQDDGSVSSEMYATVGYATAGEINATRLAQQGIDNRNQSGPSYVPDPTDIASDSDGGETEADGSGSGIVGDVAGAQGGSTSKVHHPYAKVKKRLKDHPYATVKKPIAPLPPSSDSNSNVNFHPAGAAALAPNRPGSVNSVSAPIPSPGTSRMGEVSSHSIPNNPNSANENVTGQQQQFFSGDSQDSSKGYQSISVREPLRHIQHTFNTANNSSGLLHGLSNNAHGFGPNTSRIHGDQGNDATGMGQNTYAAVSEASDDMYAAILEEPSYIPTGTSQSNSDTYAVINLPDEDEDSGGGDGSVTYQKLNNTSGSFQENKSSNVTNNQRATDRDSPDHPPIHHYSKIDKSKKRRPPPPPNTQQRHSFNVDQLYAKVQKSSNNASPVSSHPNHNSSITATHNQGPQSLIPHGSIDTRQPHLHMENNGRPRARSAYIGDNIGTSQSELTRPPPPPPHPPNMNPRTSPYAKRDVNYSDFEVTHYDLNSSSGSMKQTPPSNTEAPSPRLPLPLPSKARTSLNNNFDRLPKLPATNYQQPTMGSGQPSSHPYPLHPHQRDELSSIHQSQSIALDLQIPYADEDVNDKERFHKDANGYETVHERYPNHSRSQSHSSQNTSKETDFRPPSTDYERIPDGIANLNSSFDPSRSISQSHRKPIVESRLSSNLPENDSSYKSDHIRGSNLSLEQHKLKYPAPIPHSPFDSRASDQYHAESSSRTLQSSSTASVQGIPKSPRSNTDHAYMSEAHEPPYAKLVNERESEDEEEGYETIPPNLVSPSSRAQLSFPTRKDNYVPKEESGNAKESGFSTSESTQNLIVNESCEYDPGYEIVPTNKGSSDAGYETVKEKTKRNDVLIDNYNTIQDYGYETVKDSASNSTQIPGKYSGNEGDPGYETLVHPAPAVDLLESATKAQRHVPQLSYSTSHEVVDPGYETVPMYSEPNEFVIKGINNNNNNVKGALEKEEKRHLEKNKLDRALPSNKSQNIGDSGHKSPNQLPSSLNVSQTSPRIHMSVREMNSTSSVSSVGSAHSSVAAVNGQERRNSSVIVIEHLDRINTTERSPESNNVNNQNRHHSVNVAVNNIDHRTTSIDETTDKSTELVSSHIFV